MDLTGIQNIGEFYSHHYLDALLENDLKGLFAKWREGDETTPDRHLYRLATDFFKAKSLARPELDIQSRYEPSHRIHVALLEALGYTYSFSLRYIDGKIAIPILGAMVRDGHEYIWLVETPFPGHDQLMEEDTSPFDQCLFRQQYPQTEEEFFVPESSWEDLIGDIFHTDEPPRWLVLFAGRFIYLIDRTKWGRGQYLLFDLDEILGRRQSQTLRATAALLSREALCPDDGVPLHDTLDENSHKHAYGVSSDLKYGLRRAVELLANEYVFYQRTVAKQALFQDEDLARKLTDEALVYLYRLLFLLYAEARGSELDVVPVKAESYLKGYSLEALRDLEQVPLTTPPAQNGYYLNDSLNRLFTLVDEGYNPQQPALISEISTPVTGYQDYGFTVDGLHSPLFNRQSTPLLSSVRFRNSILQEVIQLLSLSKEKKGKKYVRGRISYSQLGINQLGAVYEALLSYSGFFATERLYEVKPADSKDADETAQTYFVPESELEHYLPEEFVYDQETGLRKSYEKGSFVFRLAGRDREKSASYYTPEVLTQCVVKYSLKELLKDKSADDILNITICEPAMGSGAFINEALNQLADAYLERKQKELGKRIPPDDYRTERQKVKYFLAVNNAYGVDLNPTAVRLAEVSLWLNILFPEAPTPWFGARLATGNSLIGARRQVYTSEDVKSGAYASKAPEACPLASEMQNEREAGRIRPRPEGAIYHWLLPDTGMAAFDKDKVIKELAPTETATIRNWRSGFTKLFTSAEIKNLVALSDQADVLWQKVLEERLQFLAKTRQPVNVWGQQMLADQKPTISIQQSEKELAWLRRSTGPYARLKLAMDYWCALWFWPIPEAGKLPTRQQFLDDMAEIFNAGEEAGFEKEPEQLGLFIPPEKPKQARLADLKPISIDELADKPRLSVTATVSAQQRFHHWELALPEVFSLKDGFDLLLGNPPWIKVKWDESGILSEFDPYVLVKKLGASDIFKFRHELLQSQNEKSEYLLEFISKIGTIQFVSSLLYYDLHGIQPNLYKAFIVLGWKITNPTGSWGVVHDYGIYDDPNGQVLRKHCYQRLGKVFRFYNQLNLFPEESLGHAGQYCVSVFSNTNQEQVSFEMIANLFHPYTIDESYSHDGHGNIPGMKTINGKWEIGGHQKRVVNVTEEELKIFGKIYESENTPALYTRLPIIHSTNVIGIMKKFSDMSKTILTNDDVDYLPTVMFDETSAEDEGVIVKDIGFPKSLDEWIVSGPHFYVSNPLAKTPRENCKSKGDYDVIDLTEIPNDYLPRTIFKPTQKAVKFIPKLNEVSVTNYYRFLNRKMAQASNERTLIGAIMPPNILHISSAFSLTFSDNKALVVFAALASSIPYDFFVRSTGKQNIREDTLKMLPLPENIPTQLISRTLRLNCVTLFYKDLWESMYEDSFSTDAWSTKDNRLLGWESLGSKWERQVALRTPYERRQALIEIDVLSSIALRINLEDLITIYRIQFPVLQDNEHRLRFDQRGMEVPMKSVSGELTVDESHPKFPDMVPPFTPVNREEDYRIALKFFEEKLKTEGSQK